MAFAPAHRWAAWDVDTWLMRPDATIADLRRGMLLPVTSGGKPARLVIGDTNLNLPVGKVWRATFKELLPSPLIRRLYVLDRGIVRKLDTGEKRKLFTRFWASCSPQDCKTYNGQLAAIMRSVRITPAPD